MFEFNYFPLSDHLCQHFLDHGYDFYALDLRKSGRSIISPEHDRYISYCCDLREYHEEITLAIEHIIQQSKEKNCCPWTFNWRFDSNSICSNRRSSIRNRRADS